MHVSEGYCRFVLETSPDGLDPWERVIVAHSDEVPLEYLNKASAAGKLLGIWADSHATLRGVVAVGSGGNADAKPTAA